MKSSLGIRPSLFLSIFLKRSVKRDFLWFINLRNCQQTRNHVMSVHLRIKSIYSESHSTLTRFLQSSQLKFFTFSSSRRYEYFSCKRRWRSHASIQTLRHLSHSSFTRGLRNAGSVPLLYISVQTDNEYISTLYILCLFMILEILI